MIILTGTNGADTLTAAPNIRHRIFGLDGDDTITGSSLDDYLDGGAHNDRISGGAGNDILIGGAGRDTLDGGTGTDTASYAGSTEAVDVDLATGIGRGGEAEGDRLRSIENLVGSAFADTLRGSTADNVLDGGDGNDTMLGNGGADTLRGGRGADRLDGGSGIDTASYSDSSSGVKVSLATGTGSGGSAAGDTLTTIENLTGSAHNDGLYGNSVANVLDGGAGNDLLQGGAGNDTLIGGDGSDTASYTDATRGVGVDLDMGIAIDDINGDGQINHLDDLNGDGMLGPAEVTDTLSGIENVTGSQFGDELFGNSGDNVLRGGGGNDLLEAAGGNDTLDGGIGDDTMFGGSDDDTLTGGAGNDDMSGGGGNDVLDGGAGSDILAGDGGNDTASYATSTIRVDINLDAGVAVENTPWNPLAIDTLSGIENAIGSAFGDVITGTDGDNRIEGGAGNDLIRAGAGVDELWGGAGNDTFAFYEEDQQNSVLPWNIEGIGDFTAGGVEDVIDLSHAGTGYASLADVLANSDEVLDANGNFAGTMIDIGPSGEVFLAGVTMASLTSQDFIL